MFFTQEDYIKIQQWLSKNSVKDTEFNEANIPFNGNEIVSIVQGNQNKKVFLKDLVNQIFNIGISDFVNITDKYDAPNISLEEAIRLIPSRARKEGQVITFLDMEDHWHIYQFKGALNQWNVLDTWEDLFDWEKFIIDSILPDEEDLTKSPADTNGNSYLSLKDRAYNPNEFSGLGRVILRKNIVDIEDPIYGKVKKNVLYQDMFTQSNTIYEIRYDFDLNGAEITIPEGCVLDFQGGSLNNGNLKLDNTNILASKDCFNSVILSGTSLLNNINVGWFGCHTYCNEQTNYNILEKYIVPSAINLSVNICHEEEGEYKISLRYPLPIGDDYETLDLKGIHIYGKNINTTITRIAKTGDANRDCILIINVSNLYIHDLSIKAVDSTGEDTYDGINGVGILGICNNIFVDNVHVYDLPYKVREERGIKYINGGKAFTAQGKLDEYSNYVQSQWDNVRFTNCESINCPIGFDMDTSVYLNKSYNVIFSNNVIKNAHIGVLLGYYKQTATESTMLGVTINNNIFVDCQIGLLSETFEGLKVESNQFYGSNSNNLLYNEKIGILLRSPKNTIITNNIISSDFNEGIIINGLSNSDYYNYGNVNILSNIICSKETGVIIGNYHNDTISNNQNAIPTNILCAYNQINIAKKDYLLLDNFIHTNVNIIDTKIDPSKFGYTAYSQSMNIPIWYDGTKYVDSNGVEVQGKHIGNSSERPAFNNNGGGWMYFDREKETLYLNTGSSWVKINTSIERQMYGLSSEKPNTNLFYGDMYFATDLAGGKGCPIWYNYKTGKWVDATGTEV